MQNWKLLLWFLSVTFFFNQLLHYNVCSYTGMACLIMLEMMVSILQEVKGLTILHYTFQEEDQFICNNFGSLFNELIIIRSKRAPICTRSDENLFTYGNEEHGKSVRIMLTCMSCDTFISFWHAVQHVVIFYMFSTLMSLEDQIELKVKAKTEISLCMPIILHRPWQSLYAQYHTV